MRRTLVALLKGVIVLVALVCCASGQQYCYSVAGGGLWHDPATWTSCNGSIPGPGDTAYVGSTSGLTYGPVNVTKGSPAVSVAAINVQQAALYINGEVSTHDLIVVYSTVVTTGRLTVFNPSNDTGASSWLRLTISQFTHAGDLTIGGPSTAEVRVSLDSTDFQVGGAMTVTSLGLARVVFQVVSVTLESKLTITGGAAAVESVFRPNMLDSWASGVSFYDCTALIKGDVTVTSRYGQAGVLGGNSGNVSLALKGASVEVRGNVAVQSADAGPGGSSGFVTVVPAPLTAAASIFYVRGSFLATSGDGGAGSATGGSAGDVTLSLPMTKVVVNGSRSGFLVESGSGGSGDNGGRGGTVNVTVGYGGALRLANDMQLLAGSGGNGAQIGGAGGSAYATLWEGGELRIKNAMLVAGDGGNISTSIENDDSSLGGNGGVSGVLIVRAGVLTVATDLALTSGRGGRGAHGGQVGPSYVLATDSAPAGDDGETQPVSEAVLTRKRTTSALLVQVGRDLRLTSATGGEGTAGPGGNCSLAFPAQLGVNQGGVTLNLYGAEMSVGRHLVIGGCHGGVGNGGAGGWAAAASVATMGATLTVGGNISVAGGSGGAAIGGSGDGGQGALAFVRGFTSSTISVKAMNLVSGQGGSAINGTGNGGGVAVGFEPGSETDLMAGIHMRDHSTLVVGGGDGSVHISGGGGGGVDTEWREGASPSAGQTANVGVDTLNVGASVTAGDLTIIGAKQGDVIVRNVPAERAWMGERDDVLPPVIKVNSYYSGKIVVNGAVQAQGHPGAINTLATAPAGGTVYFGAFYLSETEVKGKLVLRGGSGGAGTGAQRAGDGGVVLVSSGGDSTLTFTDAIAQGGAAGNGSTSSLNGAQGSVQVGANAGKIRQYGRLQLDANVAYVAAYAGGQYTVFPCNGAGIEFPHQLNGSAAVTAVVQVTTRGVFRDCRGAGAEVNYPTPTTDIYGDASCAPCSCATLAGFNSCPLDPPSPSSSSRVMTPWRWLSGALRSVQY